MNYEVKDNQNKSYGKFETYQLAVEKIMELNKTDTKLLFEIIEKKEIEKVKKEIEKVKKEIEKVKKEIEKYKDNDEFSRDKIFILKKRLTKLLAIKLK